MNFDGFIPHEISRFSSLVELDDPTALPLGVSPIARNVRFHLTSVRTRDGIQNKYGFTLPDGGAVTGLSALKFSPLVVPIPVQPAVARNPGAGAFAANRDVYIVVTLVNGNGETTPSVAFVFVNTTLNDQFAVTAPVPVAWVQNMAAPYKVTGYNVYEADVATGAAPPVLTAFKKVNGGAVALGVNTNVNNTGAGIAPPLVNGATVAGDVQIPVAFSSLGNAYIESPPGSGTMVQITGPLVNLPAAASMQASSAFAKGFLAFGDLKRSLASPAVYNPTLGTLDPCSMKLVGQPWAPNTSYIIGEVVTPSAPVGGNGHSYRCTVAGASAAVQPVFPVGEQATVIDGGVTWQENTPVIAQALSVPNLPVVTRNAGAGAFAAGRDVYINLTFVNAQGETTTSAAFKFVNTTLNDRFVVTGPTFVSLPLWEQALPAGFVPTGYNVYEADVATGNPAPALAAFKKVNGGAVAFGVNTNVDNTGAGAAPSALNSALVVGAGNICAGLRYLVVLYVNRNGAISGWATGAVVSFNGASAGFQLYFAHIPLGPANTRARILALTPAGQLNQLAGTGISNAGPYFWIPPNFPNGIFNLDVIAPGVTVADVVNGVQMNALLINDNTSTTATVNFTDDYLKSTTNDVSGYARKIQIPPCSDLYYSKTLQRMIYLTDSLPSGCLVSLLRDPESVYGDNNGGIVECAENDGFRLVTVREWNSIVYLLKEKSGHVLTPSTDDPSKWDVREKWNGQGPCGPRAVDVSTRFMCFVHRSGVWIFNGNQPFLISKELPAHTGLTWKNINWAAQQTVWVMIDEETREIRIGVPYGQSTSPSIVLKCNFEELPDLTLSGDNWAPPIHFSPYVGREIASGACYKWSIDDIAANLAIRAERTLVPPAAGFPTGFDQATIQSQILYASGNQDGEVAAITPFQFDDNGVGIDGIIESACPQDMPQGGNLMRPNRLGGVQANVDGNGRFSVEVLALRAKDQKDGGVPPAGKVKATKGDVVRLKDGIAGVPYSCGGKMTNERMRLRITNNKTAGSWFDVKWACIYATPISSARPR